MSNTNRECRVLFTHRPRLLVDCDEVLFDFQTPSLELMSHVTGKTYAPEDFTDWDIFKVLTDRQRDLVFAAIERPGFCANLKPLPGAIEAIAKIRAFADVFPVTSQFHSDPWVKERTASLGHHFGWEPGEIVFTASKYLVAGDAFLDDKPDHVVSWSRHHPDGVPMLWHIPNTRLLTQYDDFRVNSWAEVIRKVQSLVL